MCILWRCFCAVAGRANIVRVLSAAGLVCLGVSAAIARLEPNPETQFSCPHNPDALGVSRVVEIDATAAPKFGSRQYKFYDFLKEGEVVLTFDDGPRPNYTESIVKNLAEHCTMATFFPIGHKALEHPQIIKDIARQGHTVGAHTWSHTDLSRRSASRAIDEVEKGFSAVRLAVEAPIAPFFRYPFLLEASALANHLSVRNIAVFSIDVNAADYRIKNTNKLLRNTMRRLRQKGKGIILFHDNQPVTAKALPRLLKLLKSNGYKIVHMRTRYQLETLPHYDRLIMNQIGKAKVAADKPRPMSQVIRTLVDYGNP